MGQMMDKSAQMVGLKPNAMEKMSTFCCHFGEQNDLVILEDKMTLSFWRTK